MRATVDAPLSSKGGVTAIQAVVIKGHIRVVQLLFDAGADVNAAPAAYYRRTALEGAAEHGRIDMLQLLINAGARTKGDC
jgi:ankyrin repeat protein